MVQNYRKRCIKCYIHRWKFHAFFHCISSIFQLQCMPPSGSHTEILITQNKKAFAVIVSANLNFCGCLKQINPSIRIFLKVYNVKCEFKQAKPRESFSQVFFLKSECLLTLRSTAKVSLKVAKLFFIPNVKLIEVKPVITIFFFYIICLFDSNFYYFQYN